MLWYFANIIYNWLLNLPQLIALLANSGRILQHPYDNLNGSKKNLLTKDVCINQIYLNEEMLPPLYIYIYIYGQAKAKKKARTYIQQLCEDMWCNPEDLPEAMNDREK